jgi:hypothetical protein
MNQAFQRPWTQTSPTNTSSNMMMIMITTCLNPITTWMLFKFNLLTEEDDNDRASVLQSSSTEQVSITYGDLG